MSFHVPETRRVQDPQCPEYHSSSRDGNNGAFLIHLGALKFFCIASDGEIWKPIAGWEGLYEVSNKGRIAALAKTVSLPNRASRVHPYTILSQEETEKGYMRTALCRNGETIKTVTHLLVAKAFIPNHEGSDFVNHRDGCKKNNHASNLEWCTREYNAHHAIETGLMTGLKVSEILQIKHMVEKGLSCVEIASEFNRSRQTINDIKAGRHRSLDYDVPIRYAGQAWEHVSITLRTGVERCPTWEEMCKIKAIFWDEDDAVIQIHPKKSDYVTLHPTCLHLWRCTDREQALPHYALVGPLKGQTIRESLRTFEKEVSV
jgi:hypothetical protein